MFGVNFAPPSSWVIAEGSIIEDPNFVPLPYIDCAPGINVGTLQWCWEHKDAKRALWEMEISWIDLAAGCIPDRTDGKFRVRRATLLREVSWEEAQSALTQIDYFSHDLYDDDDDEEED